MLNPAISTVPDEGGINPVSIFIVVDLPAPLGPRNPKISHLGTSKLRSVIAGNSP